MKNTENLTFLKKYFDFLVSIYEFKIIDVKCFNYGLYAKFISNKIGIYFIYEYRDYIPQIQITKVDNGDLKIRPGLYTMKELYKNNNFKLQSFYLDEILSFSSQNEYKSHFQNIKTIEDAIKITAELLETFGIDYIKGNDFVFDEINMWFKNEVVNH